MSFEKVTAHGDSGDEHYYFYALLGRRVCQVQFSCETDNNGKNGANIDFLDLATFKRQYL